MNGIIKEKIESGKTYLGIEFGSTRIKAVLIDDTFSPIASGSHDWGNRFEGGIWTYSQEDIITGLQSCYKSLKVEVISRYGAAPQKFAAMGISGMMHGYMAFDKDDRLLVPFRTWRNTITEQAAAELSELFGFNIPQRWSIAHLYQAILNKEPHIPEVAHINTLAGYIHFLLTGKRQVGIGEASGIFPVENGGYNAEYIEKLRARLKEKGFDGEITDILPEVLPAGAMEATLTKEGALLIDPAGDLKEGTPLCPPEGDAGTGMTATNSVRKKTGNVSAGTSIFAMLVLENPMKGYYPEIDMVTTPDGAPVAMVHCNNCCSELDSWVGIFSEFSTLTGRSMEKNQIYEVLYRFALHKGEPDCGGVVAYNYLSGEPVTGVESGKPMYFRSADGRFNLANFFRAELYSSMAALKIGMDILFDKEQVSADKFTAHGGLFKVAGVAQQILADGLDTPVAVMKTAGEGGAWGMALLAAYAADNDGMTLPEYLDNKVFISMESTSLSPNIEGVNGFAAFIDEYKKGLVAEKAATVD